MLLLPFTYKRGGLGTASPQTNRNEMWETAGFLMKVAGEARHSAALGSLGQGRGQEYMMRCRHAY